MDASEPIAPGTRVRLRFGDDSFVATRGSERWTIAEADVLDGPTATIEEPVSAELVLPGGPEWRAWIEPNGASGIMDATLGRVTTWQDGVAVTSALPPADFTDFAVFAELPMSWRPRGVDLAVRFVLSDVPGGAIAATWVWRDGTLVGQSADAPSDLPPESVIEVQCPARPALEYICGNRSIYSVLPTGATIHGHPAMLQFFVGYVEQPGFASGVTGHQRLVRTAFADYFDHPPVGIVVGEQST